MTMKLAGLFLFAVAAFGQSDRGAISGTVADPSPAGRHSDLLSSVPEDAGTEVLSSVRVSSVPRKTYSDSRGENEDVRISGSTRLFPVKRGWGVRGQGAGV